MDQISFTPLPNLYLSTDEDNSIDSPDSPICFAILTPSDPLSYPWKFTSCVTFCEEFGIENKGLLFTIFEKVKTLGLTESGTPVFNCLYTQATIPNFLKKIIAFPEFEEYLRTSNADHCLPLLIHRIETCEQYKTQLQHIIQLFHTQPIKACLALVRFTHSVETLPEGEEKRQLHWLLENIRQTWYRENYLVKHALESPFLAAYLSAHPRWTPCIDFMLTIFKQNAKLTPEDWNTILSFTHYNGPLFCAALSQSAMINQLELSILTDFLLAQPDNLENLLLLTQHHHDRFIAWSNWITRLPNQATIIFTHWQKQLAHLSPNEFEAQKKILQQLHQDHQKGQLVLTAAHIPALHRLCQENLAIQLPTFTNREQDRLPESKRHLLSEMLLLTMVKSTCWAFGACAYLPGLMHELYNQKIAPKLGTPPTPETGFDHAFYGMYATVGKPLSGNRLFEYTAQENFKQTFLNGFKLFRQPKIGKQYFEHLHSPTMTDAEFYERVLAKP